ncbi:MAG: hypothetical protein CMM46_01320 [Rhodospirillaceae bacterium]|nr:hypothetical protein [Rhodospirillaceae bacterium]
MTTTEPYCQMRRNALAALDTAGVNYRIACIIRSYMGLQTFVLSGLAVSHVGDSSVVLSMRVLEPDDGFPPIGSVDVGIRMAPGLTEPAVERLAGAIAARLKPSALL